LSCALSLQHDILIPVSLAFAIFSLALSCTLHSSLRLSFICCLQFTPRRVTLQSFLSRFLHTLLSPPSHPSFHLEFYSTSTTFLRKGTRAMNSSNSTSITLCRLREDPRQMTVLLEGWREWSCGGAGGGGKRFPPCRSSHDDSNDSHSGGH